MIFFDGEEAFKEWSATDRSFFFMSTNGSSTSASFLIQTNFNWEDPFAIGISEFHNDRVYLPFGTRSTLALNTICHPVPFATQNFEMNFSRLEQKKQCLPGFEPMTFYAQILWSKTIAASLGWSPDNITNLRMLARLGQINFLDEANWRL